MSQPVLGMPAALQYYIGSFQVCFKWDEVCIRKTFLKPDWIEVIDAPVQPLITFQCLDDAVQPWGTIYAWDWERQDWLILDERFHSVPKSSPVVVETKEEEPEVEDIEEAPVVELEEAPEVLQEEAPEAPQEEQEAEPCDDDEEQDWSDWA